MKYDQNEIYRHHWGGGETIAYEIEDYKAVFCIFTGSSFGFYKKEDLDINSIESGYFPLGKAGKPFPWRWDSFRENMEDCIDRCLNKAKNPDTHIEWYEKLPNLEEGKWYMSNEKLCFSSDNSEGNKQRIQSNPNFVNWYVDYWNQLPVGGTTGSNLT